MFYIIQKAMELLSPVFVHFSLSCVDVKDFSCDDFIEKENIKMLISPDLHVVSAHRGT